MILAIGYSVHKDKSDKVPPQQRCLSISKLSVAHHLSLLR